ncbi:MAG: nucleotide exchange factor GrpE [Candidatus Euphemobacter frigidus]|nr:nucleotide exchange factor GrpE [Candidatus Euphemobacter frigidus]MDP8276106.1 nucleotide exchange factor GrpE [Candidatus Euphemobacter frigidus]
MTGRKTHHTGKKPDHEKNVKDQGRPEEMAEIPRSELEELRKQAVANSEYHEKMLRTMADMENLRKRIDREKKEYIDYANQELIGDLLPVLDNFDRALQSAERTPQAIPYLQGVEMIYKQLEEILKKQGLEEIKALGEPFDPHLHEAVQTEETDRYPDNTILEVILKGYIFRGKLLRPAVVKVANKVS